FRSVEETAETVKANSYNLATQLKQGENERVGHRILVPPVRPIVLFLLLAVAAVAAATQTSKQELDDQFYEAVRKGDTAAVTALLDKGADVNAKFRYGRS